MSSGGGGSSTPQNIVTTQNRDPWSGAQPYLNNIYSTAQSNYFNGVGYQPYGGPTQAPLEYQLQNALNRSVDMTADPNNLAAVNNARGLANTMQTSQGMTPDLWNVAQGIDNASGLYGQMYGQADSAQNPYLQSVLDAQGRKIADQVNSTMSGAGRYGSGAHTNVLSRNLAEAANPILAQDYQNRQQLKLQALQGQLGAYNQKAGLIGEGLNRAGQWAQLAPTLDQARFSDVDRLMGVGNFYQGRAQNETQRGIDYYNAVQAYPAESLNRFAALVGGAGGLGGSTITSQPNLNASVGGTQRALGGALAGAGLGGSIFGPYGAAIGGLGGGLLGLL